MKYAPVLAGIVLAALATSVVSAQGQGAPSGAVAFPAEPSFGGSSYTQQELDELLAPLALYPDPLVALILPASTASSDIVLASRYLASSPKANSFDEQLWDDAVKSLARYPEVIKWMDENLAWTKRLGDAFSRQPAEVMNTIQRLRARARASGALVDTPQQSVVQDATEIRIVPAQPDVIYVPRYDPTFLYLDAGYYSPGPYLTFGIGFPVGYWLAYDCDWRRRAVCVVRIEDRPRVWRECRELNRPVYRGQGERYHAAQWQVWRSPPAYHGSRRYEAGSLHASRDMTSRRPQETAALAPGNSRVSTTSDRLDSGRSNDRSVDSQNRAISDRENALRSHRRDPNGESSNRGGVPPSQLQTVTNPNLATIPSVTTPPVVSSRPARTRAPGDSIRPDQRYRSPTQDSGERTRSSTDRPSYSTPSRAAPPARVSPSANAVPPSRATYQERSHSTSNGSSSQSSSSRVRSESSSQPSSRSVERREPPPPSTRQSVD